MKNKPKKRDDALDRQMKSYVERLMSHGSDRLTFKPKVVAESNNKSSKIWSRYKKAVIDNEPVNIYKCNDCPALAHRL